MQRRAAALVIQTLSCSGVLQRVPIPVYKPHLGTSGVIQVQSKLRRSKFIQMEE